MNKKQALQKMWVPFETRLPPDTEEDILLWIDMLGCAEVSRSKIARIQHQQMKMGRLKMEVKNEPTLAKTGYNATHWMKIVGPKGGPF